MTTAKYGSGHFLFPEHFATAFDTVPLNARRGFYYSGGREIILLKKTSQQRNISDLEKGWAEEMKNSLYKSYDELPLFLNADTVAKTLGIAISSCYELLKETDFPSITIGNRIVVPKDQFIQWVENKARRSD